MRVLKWVLVFAGATFLIVLAVTMLDRGVTFTLTFDDSKSLRAGDPLLLEGIEIGQVLFVVPREEGPDEVIVRIVTRHRARAHKGLRFVLARVPSGDETGSGWRVEVSEGEDRADEAILKGELLAGEASSSSPAPPATNE